MFIKNVFTSLLFFVFIFCRITCSRIFSCWIANFGRVCDGEHSQAFMRWHLKRFEKSLTAFVLAQYCLNVRVQGSYFLHRSLPPGIVLVVDPWSMCRTRSQLFESCTVLQKLGAISWPRVP
ncbi:unnamed protein product [Amoebophrya sp. A25]|nr:unnamed protein product [Amoebophrya sp. A25]|eukprot:GSA25T00021298001.1